MKTVIIEDENIAAQNLERILKMIAPDVEVLAVL